MTPNLAAFLAVIRACEGTSGPNGYRTLFGGELFDSYADHPRIVVSKSGYKSTAAGAYQALAGTWDDFIKAEGPHDFSPSSQDLFARWCITRRGALADVEAGRLRAAIEKCNKEWASLPGSPYGQPTRDLAFCERIFHLNGGGLIDKPPAPPAQPKPEPAPQPAPPVIAQPTKEPRMGALAVLQMFGPILAGLIPQISTILKPESEVAKRNTALAETLVNTITAAAAAPNMQAAVEKMQADPAVVAEVQKAVVTEPVIMAALQIGPGNFKEAAERSAAIVASADKWWKIALNPVLLVTFATLPLVYIIVIKLVEFMGKVSADVIAQTIGTVIGLVLGGVMGFWMGQTYQQTRNRTGDPAVQQVKES